MLQANDEIQINTDISPLIPVICHYDNSTLMTRDGDLLQIIQINGFEENDELFRTESLRDAFRKVITKHVKSVNYAIYIHVLNNPRNIIQNSSFPSELAKKLDSAWNQENMWEKQDISTMYVTIVAQGLRPSLFDSKTILQALFFPLFKNRYAAYLKEQCAKLSEITDNIAKDLTRFSTKKLTLKKVDEKYISEPLSFFYNLLHLKEKEIAIDYCNTAEQLADLDIEYLFSTLLIRSNFTDQEQKPISAAVYTLKAPYDLDVSECMLMLESDCKYIISEVMLFAPANLAMKSIAHQKKIIGASMADSLLDMNGISKITAHNDSNTGKFCERQITVTIYDEDSENFVAKTNAFIKTAHEIGFAIVREDFNCAKCFLSQLPGNFRYITRKQYNSSAFIGLFSSLPTQNTGSYHGSKWGPPVTILKTQKNSPYYFNFHNMDNGHTIIMGEPGTGKSTFVKFLLAQATRINPKIIHIAFDNRNTAFLEQLSAKTIKISNSQENPIGIDLFNLGNFQNDSVLFNEFFLDVIISQYLIKEKYQQNVADLVERLLAAQLDERLSILKEFMEHSNYAELAVHTKGFIEQFYLLLCKKDDLNIIKDNHIINLDFSEYISDPVCVPFCNAFVSMLLLKITDILDGSPTVIVFNDLHLLAKNKIIEYKLKQLMEKLIKKNAVILFSAKYEEKLYTSQTFQENFHLFATQVFMVNKFADNALKKSLNLTVAELYKIKSYGSKKPVMLIKQHTDSIVVKFDFHKLLSLIQ